MNFKLNSDGFKKTISALALCAFSTLALAKETGGFALGATRVVFNEEKKEANLTVINSMKNTPFLTQSWLTNYDDAEKKKPPFIITPPLYRQDAGKNALRIMRAPGNLPSDRESAFWINVKAIPAGVKPEEAGNSISLAYVIRLKLFYRPAQLSGSADLAYQSLTFGRQGNALIISNPTPYYVTLSKVYLNGQEVKKEDVMVSPFGKYELSKKVSSGNNKITFQAINDLGGLSPSKTVTF